MTERQNEKLVGALQEFREELTATPSLHIRRITPQQLYDWTVEWIMLVHDAPANTAEPTKHAYLAHCINEFFNQVSSRRDGAVRARP
jgi:hypothetical protein